MHTQSQNLQELKKTGFVHQTLRKLDQQNLWRAATNYNSLSVEFIMKFMPTNGWNVDIKVGNLFHWKEN